MTGLTPFLVGMVTADAAALAWACAHPDRVAAKHGIRVDWVISYLNDWRVR